MILQVKHINTPIYKAVQWAGSNLRELQDLAFPSSPVYGPGINNPALPSAAGLVQIPMGAWVLRISEVPEFLVLSDDTFRQIFTPDMNVSTARVTNRKVN